MSRHTPLDHDFNFEVYIQLIKQAQGTRQQKDFAKEVGISSAYLNRALTGRYDKPFMPGVLRKIAEASEGRVEFKELLSSAGYDYRKHMKYEDFHKISNISFQKQLEQKKDIDNKMEAIKGIISAALAQKGLKWSGVTAADDDFNLRIKLYDLPISEWGFIFADYADTGLKPAPTSNTVQIATKIAAERILGPGVKYVSKQFPFVKPDDYNRNTLSFFSNKLLFTMRESGQKITLVTASQDRFSKYCKESIIALAHHVSIALVDIENFKVLEEKTIQTLTDDSEGIPTLI